MLTQDRQAKILSILNEQGSVTVSRLTEILSASESTVRRDLAMLASEGKLNKVHGGATALNQEFIKFEDNIEEKLTKHTNEKVKIAEYAASQIQDDDFVFVDESAFKYLWRVNLNETCIVLPNIGANIGEVYYVEPSELPEKNNVLGPNAILLRTNEDKYFVFTLLGSDVFQKQSVVKNKITLQ